MSIVFKAIWSGQVRFRSRSRSEYQSLCTIILFKDTAQPLIRSAFASQRLIRLDLYLGGENTPPSHV